MTKINGSSSIAALVALQLERRRKSAHPGSTAVDGSAEVAPLALIRTLTGNPAVGERRVRKALVRAMLIDQFGGSYGNDPSFEDVASAVFETLEASELGKEAITAAMAELLNKS